MNSRIRGEKRRDGRDGDIKDQTKNQVKEKRGKDKNRKDYKGFNLDKKHIRLILKSRREMEGGDVREVYDRKPPMIG